MSNTPAARSRFVSASHRHGPRDLCLSDIGKTTLYGLIGQGKITATTVGRPSI